MTAQPQDNKVLDDDVHEAARQQGIRNWVSAKLGGQVTEITRLERWRPQWKVTYKKDGAVHSVLFRGNRSISTEESLRFEMEVMQVLEANGVKVPHIYGWVEDPVAFVMDWIDTEDRAPGMLHTAIDNPTSMSDERWQAMLNYMEDLAGLHNIPVGEFANIPALAKPLEGATQVALHATEDMYQRGSYVGNIDPVLEFLQVWLRRNVPVNRTEVNFIAGDAGQFMSAGTEVLALMDFEIANIGDIHWDLACFRGRHPYENMGDIPALYRHYEKVSGREVDLRVVGYHTVNFLQLSGIAAKFFMYPKARGGNWIEGLLENASITRRALEAIAELEDVPLDYDLHLPDADVDPLEASGLQKLLADIKRLPTSSAFAPWERDLLHSIPEFLLNYAHYRRWFEAETLADIAAFTGEVFDSLAGADKAMMTAISEAGPERNPELVQIMHRRTLRLSMIIAGTDPNDTNPLFHKLDPILSSD